MKRSRRCRPAAALALMLLLALGACAKRHLYPGDRLPDDQVSTLEAERFLLANVEVAIDGMPAGTLAQSYIPPGVAGGWPGGVATGVTVLPGNHDLAIRVASYGWLGAGRIVCAAMPFASEAGERYRLAIDKGILYLRNARTGAPVAETPFTECDLQAGAGERVAQDQRSSSAR